ncbi:MAG: EVE domain-containing protein [Pseudolabrys sp.]|nr:EVE domain-containing protein [Pseudolabrys sp.]
MSANWIAVACATHVARGVAGGFMQVCHGKAAPLRRIAPGDNVAYYSPTLEFGGKDRLQAFTAIGIVVGGDPYRVDMGGGSCPYRRDVSWVASYPAPIKPLLEQLALCAGKRNWGYQFRFGLLAVSDGDMAQIAGAMQAVLPATAEG